MTTEFLIVEAADAGIRLDVFLSKTLEITRSAAQGLIEAGQVQIAGLPAKKKYPVGSGDQITVFVPDARPCTLEAQNIPLEIVYEDRDLLVINKPQGMVVHPAAGNWDGTLVNALLYHCAGELSGINGELRPGIVHRLDKDTSGLMLAAKNDAAHQGLAAQIAEHSVCRVYHAVIVGHLRESEGTVNAPIGRHKTDRKKMCVTADGREAITHYRVLAEYPGFSYVECRLETGRTHQIRVHMAHLGHPIAGDPVYGVKDKSGLKTQCLHSKTITFTHPISGETLCFESDLPAVFADFLKRLQ
ncbi:MAG: RluA family pseudouridine synthase [Oscillospiraceae bacterium]|nr:RluA family pseudouridine synthase [Oscillospiraceae bacterium]